MQTQILNSMFRGRQKRSFGRRPKGRGKRLNFETLESRYLLSGTPQLLKDIFSGGIGANPSNLITVNETLFFTSDDGIHGVELWKSDGTETGTAMVKDIQVGASGSFPSHLTAIGTSLYFWASDGLNGIELWRSDGTSDGTALVKDINPGLTNSFPGYSPTLVNIGGSLYFPANDGTHGTELWTSDGTAAGTVLVKDVFAGSISSGPQQLIDVGGVAYFAATGSGVGPELWTSDGTAAGTHLVKEIKPGSEHSYIFYLTTMGGVAYFAADDGATGGELWRSDGTESGTYLVKDIYPGTGWSSPSFLTPIADQMFFSAGDGTTGAELWISDGTSAGTHPVKDIRSGSGGSNPSKITAFGPNAIFVAFDSLTGQEPWISDGTEAGTVPLADIQPGIHSSASAYFTNVNGAIYFAATDSTNGRELWKTDGTAAGTTRVMDIYPGSESSSPSHLASLGGRLFFTANDGVHGAELWILEPGHTTELSLNAGNLVITDISNGGQDDTLTIQSDTANGVFVVSDASQRLGATGIPGAVVSGDQHTVTIPFDVVTGTSIFVDTHSGSDGLIVDFALGDFVKTIHFAGGVQDANDTLTLNGGGTRASVIHQQNDASSGNVLISGNNPINHAGLQAIVDNLGAADRVFAFSDTGEAITLTDATAANSMTIGSTHGAAITFANPTNSLTINPGHADDVLSVLHLPDFDRSLILGSESARFGHVGFLGPVALASGYSLSVDATTIGFELGAAGASTRGAGSISLSAARSISMTSTTHLTAEDGEKAKKVSGTFYAKHPKGRPGKRFLTPFPQVTPFPQAALLRDGTSTGFRSRSSATNSI